MNRRTFLKMTAIAGLGSMLPLSACSSGGSSPESDRVLFFTNGTIYLDAGRSVQSLTVTNGRVSGYNQSASTLPAAQVIDLKGGAVYPGFHDSHNHLMESSLVADGPDLLGLSTADAFAAKIRQAAASGKFPDAAPILGDGFILTDYNAWSLDDLAKIDAASGTHPVILMDNLGHNAIANSIALQLSHITPATPVPFAGIVGIQDGKLTGMLRETAMVLVGNRILSMISDDSLLAATEKLLTLWASSGYTSINDMMGNPLARIMRPQMFKKLESQGRLSVRVNCAYTVFTLDDVEAAFACVGQDTDMVRFLGCKVFVDGAFGAGQAWTSWKNLQGGNGIYYAWNDDSYGRQYNLNRIVERVEELGMNMHYHVQGDMGIEAILNALDGVTAKRGRLNSVHTFIHLGFPRQDQLLRMKGFGRQVNVTMQPALYKVEADSAEYYGADRMKGAYPIATVIEAGITTGISTDFSVSPLNLSPSLSLLKTALQSPNSPITLKQAIEGLTTGSAATIPKQDTGTLDIGKWADLVVFDRDLAGVPAAKLDDPSSVKRVATWVGGRQTA